jgi:hypothetical protein
MSGSVHLSDAMVAPDQHSDQPSLEATQTSESPAAVAVADRKLPYQASHQAELIHLEAEIEALLQRLQALKQQRMTEANLVTSR